MNRSSSDDLSLGDEVPSSIQKDILDYSHQEILIKAVKPVTIAAFKAMAKKDASYHKQLKSWCHDDDIDIYGEKEFDEGINSNQYASIVEPTKHTIERKANHTIGDRYTFILSFIRTIS